MNGNLNYVLVEKSIFHSEVRSSHGVFEALHMEARIKQMRLLEQQQVNRMDERYKEIQQEEHISLISHGSKLILGARKVGDFYDYNRQWQMGVHQRRETRNRVALQDLSQISEDKENRTNRVDVGNHRGPVRAWNEHFIRYIKRRTQATNAEEDGLFHPKIDKQSEKIARRNGVGEQPVEERLLRYGQLKKLNRVNEIREHMKEAEHKKRPTKANAEIFERLYFDGKKINKKRLEMSDQNCTFQPAINTKTCYDQRVQEIRKPLYFVKTEPQYEDNNQSEKKLNKQDFEKFLQRNVNLLLKRRELVAKKPSNIDDGYADCTFKPVINGKSAQMVEILRKEAFRQTEIKKIIDVNNLREQASEQLPEKKHKVSVPKIKTMNLLNFSAELLQTEDSLPMRTMESQRNTQKISDRRYTEPDDRQLILEQQDHEGTTQNLFTDEFDLIERQLEEMLRQAE